MIQNGRDAKEAAPQSELHHSFVLLTLIGVALIFWGSLAVMILFSFDPIIRLGSKSQERQKFATNFISIKKLLRYFSGSFAVGGVVMFYLR